MLGDVHIGERASDLLDGRLSPPVERQLRAHLGECPRCADLVRAEGQVRRMLRGSCATAADAPSHLMAGLMSLPGGSMTMPAGRPRQPGRRAKAGLLVAGAAITVGFAAPVVVNAGPALASMIPSSWLTQSQPAAQLVVVPAGPRGGIHTVWRTTTSTEGPDSPRP